MIGAFFSRLRSKDWRAHWWEYFRNGVPDEEFIGVLHEVAAWLASRPDIRVVSFRDVADGKVSLGG